MKKIYSLLFLVIILFTALQVQANEITVKGRTKLPDGSPAKNIIVNFVVTTFSGNSCTATATSDNDGYYTKAVSCTGDISKVSISVKNCDGQVLAETREVPSTKVVEQNFILCLPPPVACVAKFELVPADPPVSTQGFPFKFNSGASETGSGDKIVERIWKFGDGEQMTGNVVDPTHLYKATGTYTICLTIRSDKGCSNTKCITIEVKTPCKANFTFEPTVSGIKFNSNTSTTLPNDPITTRTWNFGDGTAEVKNLVDPTHAFKPGTYTVCLSTRTGLGCESKECKQVVVPSNEPVAKCEARFSFNRLAPKKFSFNSGISIVGAGDNVVERVWDFRDGSGSTEANPTHEFSKPGNYEVCLKIKTAKGCESKFCVNVKVEEVANNNDAFISIVSMYPTPVKAELKTLVFSKINNISATIAIVDVYGNTKWSKQVTLVQGNNPFNMQTGQLLAGPYFFKVISLYGTQSKSFYKL